MCSDGTITIEPFTYLKHDEDNYLVSATPSDPNGFEFQGGELVDSTALGVGESAFDRDISKVPQPTSISLPNAINLENYAFFGCDELVSASLPSVTTIGYGVFGDCNNLESLALPSITNPANILDNAFEGSGLTSLQLTGLSVSDV